MTGNSVRVTNGVDLVDLRTAMARPTAAGRSSIQISSGKMFFHPDRGTQAISDEYPTLVRRGMAQKAATAKPRSHVATVFLVPSFHRITGRDAMSTARVVMRCVSAIRPRTRPARGILRLPSRTIWISNPKYTITSANDQENENSPASVDGMLPP